MQRMEETMASVNYRMNDMSSMDQTIASMSYLMSGMTSMINANFAKIDSIHTHENGEQSTRSENRGKIQSPGGKDRYH